MKLKPVYGNVIVKEVNENERTTESGLFIPEKTAEPMRFAMGEVLFAATERENPAGNLVPMQLKVGDKIYFDKVSAREFSYQGQEFFCLDETKAYGVVEL